MRLRGESTRLLVQAAYVLKTLLPANGIHEMHASAARQHEDPPNPRIVQKTDYVVRKLDQERTARLESSSRSASTATALLFHGCGYRRVFMPNACASFILSDESSTMMSPHFSHLRYSP